MELILFWGILEESYFLRNLEKRGCLEEDLHWNVTKLININDTRKINFRVDYFV